MTDDQLARDVHHAELMDELLEVEELIERLQDRAARLMREIAEIQQQNRLRG